VFVPLAIGGSPLQESGVLVRAPVPFTEIPDRPREGVITYTVQLDDTVLGIAEQFKLNPNTILWANLEDLTKPFVMEVGQILLIAPVDGVLHTVKEGDTVAKIAKLYKVEAEAIVGHAPNQLASVDDALTVGAVLVVPDGDRTPPEQIAVAPSAPRGGGASAPWRASGFVWPTYGLLTQRYWLPAHPAIDIGASTGTPVAAADEGTVITAGWSSVGYGNMIVIRHSDGFVDPVCPPEQHRRELWRLRGARPAHRRGGFHRPLHRTPPALRSLHRRPHLQSADLSAVNGTRKSALVQAAMVVGTRFRLHQQAPHEVNAESAPPGAGYALLVTSVGDHY
jgi:LysM repeat protein